MLQLFHTVQNAQFAQIFSKRGSKIFWRLFKSSAGESLVTLYQAFARNILLCMDHVTGRMAI